MRQLPRPSTRDHPNEKGVTVFDSAASGYATRAGFGAWVERLLLRPAERRL
jgi:hypothetical protein